jgi:hypothetical protein
MINLPPNRNKQVENRIECLAHLFRQGK